MRGFILSAYDAVAPVRGDCRKSSERPQFCDRAAAESRRKRLPIKHLPFAFGREWRLRHRTGMMRPAFVLTVSFALISSPALAQHGHGGGKPLTTPHVAAAPKPVAPHGAAGTTHATTHVSSHGSASHGSAPHGGASHGSASHGSTTHVTSSHGSASRPAKSTSSSHGTTSMATLTPVQQKLHRNTRLASKLRSRLPPGTNLDTAAAGFRNLGQFVAAVNVSHNLGIPFSELKTRMVEQGMSLGQAARAVRATNATTGTTEHR
jgi:hypothetical protein